MVTIKGQLQLLMGWVFDRRWNGEDSWEYRLSGSKKNTKADTKTNPVNAAKDEDRTDDGDDTDWYRESDLELDD